MAIYRFRRQKRPLRTYLYIHIQYVLICTLSASWTLAFSADSPILLCMTGNQVITVWQKILPTYDTRCVVTPAIFAAT